MSVDTHARILDGVRIEEVLNVVRQTIDETAYIDNFDDHYSRGWLKVKYQGKYMNIFFCYVSDRFYTVDNERLEPSRQLYLSGASEEITISLLIQILSYFGGYIDENDCDDEYYYWVNKTDGYDIQPPIRVTMQEIYEKFGRVVIITDR